MVLTDGLMWEIITQTAKQVLHPRVMSFTRLLIRSWDNKSHSSIKAVLSCKGFWEGDGELQLLYQEHPRHAIWN